MRFFISTLLVFLFFSGCCTGKKKVERGIYYWKNRESALTITEIEKIRNTGVKQLYVKFFEVEPDAIFGEVPTAKLSLYGIDEIDIPGTEIIPVVFVRNEVFKSSTEKSLKHLADNIVFLIGKYYKEKFSSFAAFKEIQIDCDWTASTKKEYFTLLKLIKEHSGRKISCTLRLYPFKYPDKMGVPPVDRATLMCYNLIDPLRSQNRNSILDLSELQLYLQNNRPYPLKLDVVLPVFSWMQVYKNKQFAGLINGRPEDLAVFMREIKPMWYEVTQSVTIGDVFLHAGDRVKAEFITPQQLHKASLLIKRNIRFPQNARFSLFHLDEEQLKYYKNDEINRIYSNF